MASAVNPLALLWPRNYHHIRTPQLPPLPERVKVFPETPLYPVFERLKLCFFYPDEIEAWQGYMERRVNLTLMRIKFGLAHMLPVAFLVALIGSAYYHGQSWTPGIVGISIIVVSAALGIWLEGFYCSWDPDAGMTGGDFFVKIDEDLRRASELRGEGGRAEYRIARECLVAQRGRRRLNPEAAILWLYYPFQKVNPQRWLIAYSPLTPAPAPTPTRR